MKTQIAKIKSAVTVLGSVLLYFIVMSILSTASNAAFVAKNNRALIVFDTLHVIWLIGGIWLFGRYFRKHKNKSNETHS
jgi:hypothetical protein